MENNLNSLKDCRSHVEQFFAQKDKKFRQDRIMNLPGKWQKKMVNTLFNKGLGKMKNLSFIFT